MRTCLVLGAVSLLASTPAIAAQSVSTIPVWGEVFVGSELENYVRVLQTRGVAPEYPWSVRSFSAGEVARLADTDSGHPWAERYGFQLPAQRAVLALLRPALTIRGNTTFPYGYNDGPVWAGRGLTTALEAGLVASYGPLSLTIAPVAFRAENAAFRLMANGATGRLAYGDGVYWGSVDLERSIDLPQRFGDGAYTVLDPGQSVLRLDAKGVTVGFSTANQSWGPAREYPILLGNNAPGFPHAFLGTSTPVDLHVVRVHGRIMWGRLTQSDYSPETQTGGLRLGTGAVAVLTSRWVPGLEVGASRFAHLGWPGGALSLSHFLYPLKSQQREHITGTTEDNQLASIFFRWVLPRSGFELYAEYGREDFWEDLRDVVAEPDHWGGYTIGFAKVLGSGPMLRTLRAEIQDLQPSVLAQGRGVIPFYVHSVPVRQGHTQRGQLLGSHAGFGGAGAIAALDTYHRGGRWTLSWSRSLRRQRGAFATDTVIDARGLDVMHALSWSALFFRCQYDITASVAAVYEFNRDFRADYVNFNATFGVRRSWR